MGLIKKNSNKYDITYGDKNILVDYASVLATKTLVNSITYTLCFTVSLSRNIKMRLTVRSQNVYSDQKHDLLIKMNGNTLIESKNNPTIAPFITRDIDFKKGDVIQFYIRGQSSAYPNCYLNALKFTYDFNPSINTTDFITGG